MNFGNKRNEKLSKRWQGGGGVGQKAVWSFFEKFIQISGDDRPLSICISGVGCNHLQGSLRWEEITLSPPVPPPCLSLY